ncbi:response regulator transcription factor [Mangrovicoccus algicola]|uniref:Response regulator transcription factor n=1 Tax=Mangrovicoccus algicola TaxID=2771008 RepID=A0A8J6Z3F7_9RHOB|nr:response regulator transcription factor [Mangrovicoccus algicola]MBE3636744.1 response regulator transcription factor [Mangrovicoccus algicola]
MRVTLIEDNEGLAGAIRDSLEDHGFGVDWLADGAEGAAFLAAEGADVAVLDLNLPGRHGLEILRGLRAAGNPVPVLVLTAMGRTSDRVGGLEAGADDYLVKPFEMAELIARIRALGRRGRQVSDPVEQLGMLRFDRASRRLDGPDGSLALPRRELALFECLLAHRGRVVPRERIADTLYGTGADVETNALDLLVSRLRRKLEGSGVVIRTARGLGYMLDAAAR